MPQIPDDLTQAHSADLDRMLIELGAQREAVAARAARVKAELDRRAHVDRTAHVLAYLDDDQAEQFMEAMGIDPINRPAVRQRAAEMAARARVTTATLAVAEGEETGEAGSPG